MCLSLKALHHGPSALFRSLSLLFLSLIFFFSFLFSFLLFSFFLSLVLSSPSLPFLLVFSLLVFSSLLFSSLLFSSLLFSSLLFSSLLFFYLSSSLLLFFSFLQTGLRDSFLRFPPIVFVAKQQRLRSLGRLNPESQSLKSILFLVVRDRNQFLIAAPVYQVSELPLKVKIKSHGVLQLH